MKMFKPYRTVGSDLSFQMRTHVGISCRPSSSKEDQCRGSTWRAGKRSSRLLYASYRVQTSVQNAKILPI